MTTGHGESPADALALERIVFFSDAVMAIAITLLALDLRLPDTSGTSQSDFLNLIGALVPRYLSFAISFAVVALYWISHHRLFRYIVGWDSGLLVMNFLFLFFVVQLPLLNSILGSYGDLSAAAAIYAGGLALIGLTIAGLWAYSSRRGLLVDGVTPAFRSFVWRRSVIVAAAFALTIPLAFISPFAAEIGWLLIAGGSRYLDRNFPPAFAAS